MSKFRLLIMAVAASSLFTLAPALTDAGTGAISGVVTDAGTGDPVSGALVNARITGVFGWHLDFTDADGAYLIDDLDTGTYELSVRRFGYVTETATVEVKDGHTTPADIALDKPAFGTVTGTVTDASTGDPIAHARVTTGSWFTSAFTDKAGKYTIKDVRTGDRRVVVSKSGYYSDVATVTVADGETTTHDVALDHLSYGNISGVVTDSATGEPIKGARVQVGFSFWNSAMTDADGKYSIEDLVAGDRTVVVWKWGYYGDVSTVTVLDGETTTHDVALDPFTYGTLSGVVTDADSGDPIEGVWVQVGFYWWNSAVTNAAGEYTIEDILAGDYTVTASMTGYYTGEAAVTVTSGATTTADFALDPLAFGSISGVVTNSETGAPIKSAWVQAGFAWWSGVFTNADGEYTIEDVVAGEQTVYVSKFFYYSDTSTVEVIEGATATHDVALDPF